MSEPSAGFVLPVVDDEGQPFWDGTAVGELRVQRCAGCERFRFPPRPMCPHCQSTESTWPAVSGHGTVWSYVVPHAPLLPAFADVARFNVIVVALDDDPTIRLVGNLVGSADAPHDFADPSNVEIGAPVRVVFAAVSDGIHLPRWLPAGS